MESQSTLFFSDGQRTIDFVLVYNSSLLNEESLAKLEVFIDNLRKSGLELQVEHFSTQESKFFVLIHIPKEITERYADIFDIDLMYKNVDHKITQQPWFKFMSTSLTRPTPEDPVYARAPDSMSGQWPKDITTSEKILVVDQILSRTKYNMEKGNYGIQRLIKEKVFEDAFPLHEGPHQWPDTGPLTDRQLLAKYWGSPGYWYKEQPINLIEKYYGSELAFYFAWLGHYVKMLIPAAILSLLCVIYGLISLSISENFRSKEICESVIVMCPKCHYHHCLHEKLSNSCIHSYVTYLFDNPATITYAIIVSFWSTVFMELWGRRQAMLQLQWNVKHLEHDISMRPEYVEAAAKTRISDVTGLPEPYEPINIKVAKYTVTTASVLLMLLIMVLGTFGVMVYRLAVSLTLQKTADNNFTTKYSKIIAATTGSFMSVVFILIFKMIYSKVALWLTDLENHRTQYEYDHSYIYKSYALEFTNHYSAVFYIAFFKGKFFTYPGDIYVWTSLGGIASDICDPTGCILDLSLQLIFIMIIKTVVSLFVQILFPWMLGLKSRYMHGVGFSTTQLPCYEKDYLKAPLNRFYLIQEYMDMVMQYGYVVFFVAGFPPAPFLALANNLAELRVDAYKITHQFRRPIPKRVAGIGAWKGILQGMTYMGVVTNAIVIAFTSDFVPKEIYKYEVNWSLKGFVNTTISAFDRGDFHMRTLHVPFCYYPGRRYPPDHPMEYQLTNDYWFVLTTRFLVVLIFSHVVMLTNGLIAYAIPDVPANVKERLAIEESRNKELRMAAAEKLNYDPERKRPSIVDQL